MGKGSGEAYQEREFTFFNEKKKLITNISTKHDKWYLMHVNNSEGRWIEQNMKVFNATSTAHATIWKLNH